MALLESGASIFLTGGPGSGKTHTVNRYMDLARRRGVAVDYTASTGIAATQGDGITIHSWSGIGVSDALSPRDLQRIAANRRVAARIERAQVLIIDEISMLPARTLNLVDLVCRHVRERDVPFGGLQVVLVGDFFQLPPVSRRRPADAQFDFGEAPDEDLDGFAYRSSAWRDLAPTVCYLAEQHRQGDQGFVDILNAIRDNACFGPPLERLEARLISRDRLPSGCPRLFTHNAAVDQINERELAKLDSTPKRFSMATKGAENFVQALQRGCLSPAELTLKVGAIVMFTRNDPAGRFVNGTLGTVLDFEEKTGSPRVRTLAGKPLTVEPAKWKVEVNGKEQASITQVPLRLAWAMTVHKAQGMSLDAAVIDLSRAFEYGQGYVALSRLRSLDGLHLLGLNDRALRVHPQAVEMDAAFRAESDAARTSIDRLPREAQPIANVAPVAERALPANAYAPWSPEEERDLVQRYQAGEPVKAIAEAHGRKTGAIRSRLKKLDLL